jgi:Fe-S-cluster containining protein
MKFAGALVYPMTIFESYCKICKKNVHCCIFKHNAGFTFVGLQDAKKIKRKIRKEYTHFIDYSVLPIRTINALKNNDAVLEGALRYDQLDQESRLLRLKTKEDGRCIFQNDVGKCDIYSARPKICRIYPFWAIRLTDGTLKIITHDPYPRCGIIKRILSQNKNNNHDIESALSKKQRIEIKKTFNQIINENKGYKKNIRKFAEKISEMNCD